MNSMYDLIVSLEELKRESLAIQEREARLTRPLIYDLERMGEVYSSFREISDARNVFIIIAVRLFSPRALAGNNLRAGLRNKLAEVLGCEPTVISHAFENLVFHYKKYKTFRQEVDLAYRQLCEKLQLGEEHKIS